MVQDCARQAGAVLPGELPLGADLHQGSDHHDQRPCGTRHCQARREHHDSAVYALPVRPRMNTPKYRRILLKISGEILAGEQGYGIHPAVLDNLADEIGSVVSLGVEVAVVIGGGNGIRGMAPSETRMVVSPAEF